MPRPEESGLAENDESYDAGCITDPVTGKEILQAPHRYARKSSAPNTGKANMEMAANRRYAMHALVKDPGTGPKG